jgi:hypothetical protein
MRYSIRKLLTVTTLVAVWFGLLSIAIAADRPSDIADATVIALTCGSPLYIGLLAEIILTSPPRNQRA